MKNQAIKIVGTIVIVGGMVFFASGVGAQEISGKFAHNSAGFARMIDSDGDAKAEHGPMKGVRHIDPEIAKAVRTALQNKDYEAWKSTVAQQEENMPEGAQSLLEKIDTEEAFLEFAAKMENRETDKIAREEVRQEIQEAVASNDYETWKTLVAAREAAMENLQFSMLEKIGSEADFAKLVRIHELQEEIRGIREDLGLLDLGNKMGYQLGQK